MTHRHRKKYFRGIYRRMLWITIPLVVICTVLTVGGTLLVLRGEIWDWYEKSVLSGIEALSEQISLCGEDLAKIRQILDRSRKSKARYFVYGTRTFPSYWSEGTPTPGDILETGFSILGDKRSSVAKQNFGNMSCILAAARAGNDHILVLAVETGRLKALKWKGAILVLGLVLSSVIMIAFLMSRHLVRPLLLRLEQLKDSLSTFGSGQRDVRLDTDPRSESEFDEVFAGFNTMAEQICEYEREKALRAKEEKALFAHLAHDINTPIAVLRASAENLNVYGDCLPPSKRKRIFADMLAQCLYIESLINDLLTMASAKVAEISCNPKKIVLDDLFDSLVNTFSPIVDQRNIVLLADGHGLSVWADPVRLRQIMTNLIRNSIVHGGNVSIIEIDAHMKGEMVSIVVKDDGKGIDSHDIDRLFNSFEREDDAASVGWGLGLAIVKMLSELQGGTCLFRSSSTGVAFEVILPHGPMGVRNSEPGNRTLGS